MCSKAWRVLSIVVAALVWLEATAGKRPEPTLQDREEAFAERVLQQAAKLGWKGTVGWLREEQAKKPRPYVAAWIAQFQLLGYEFNLAEVENRPEGFTTAYHAMQEGSLLAKELVGYALTVRDGAPRWDPVEGADLLRQAAEAGRGSAMDRLATLYFWSRGVPGDLAEADRWARRAAHLGYPGSLCRIGTWTELGAPGRPGDGARASRYYYEAALWRDRNAAKYLDKLAQRGVAEAKKYTALWILDEQLAGADVTSRRMQETVKYLEDAWPEDPEVLAAVGAMRMEINHYVYDPSKARKLLEKAAALGSTDAEFHLAEMARRGIGSPKDLRRAVAELQRLADLGNARALGRLGWMHYWAADKGSGIKKDEKRAFELVRAAAHAGDQLSVMNLAFLYEHGLGTPVNYQLAARYYGVAAKIGYREARAKRLSNLAFAAD